MLLPNLKPLRPIQLPHWPSRLHRAMPPTYSLPPVSPTQGDQIEISMVTHPRGSNRSFYGNTRGTGTWFSITIWDPIGHPIWTESHFCSRAIPLAPISCKRPGDSLGHEASDSDFPTGARVTLTVRNKLTDFLINTGDLKRLVNVKQRGNKVIPGDACLYLWDTNVLSGLLKNPLPRPSF